jgi:hypothetical protein
MPSSSSSGGPGGRPRPTVLGIAGTGKCGATLLSRLLGRLPGFVAVGEIGRLWDKGLTEDRECSCGEPFRTCPFWAEVGQRAFGGWDRVDTDRALRLRGSITARPGVLFILSQALWPRRRVRLRAYAALMGELYRAIAEVSGAEVIVDSMKTAPHVYMLRQVPSVDLKVLHLTRDSRGVAYSNTKWVKLPSAMATGGTFRSRQSVWRTSRRWLLTNLKFHLLAWLGAPTLFMKYEALAASPREELHRVAAFLSAPVEKGDLGFVHDGFADLPADHLALGNAMRFGAGMVPIRVDDEWRKRLPPRQRRAVLSLTWPLLLRYGYLTRRK